MSEPQSLNVSPKIRNSVFLMFFICFFILFYYVKYQSPAFINSWYQNQDYEWLNKLSGVGHYGSKALSLGYYLGQIEERFFGPLSQLISGLLFTIIALLFLSKASRWQFCLAVFGYLVLTKLEVLLFPPYGDAIGGPFAEAIWLKQNGFSYSGLLQQPGYAIGGPKVYVFSIYPTFLGLFMALLPNIKVFLIIQHLFVFAMAAGMVALFREIAARTFSSTIAIFLSLILLYLPLFQCQTEAINMEMPCAFFALFAAYELIKGKFSQACAMAVFSVLIKGIGIFSCAAVLLVSVVMWLSGTPGLRRDRRVIFGWLVLVVAMGLSLSVKYFIKDQHVSAGMVNFFVGWPSLKFFFISRLYLIAVFIITIAWVVEKLRQTEFMRQKYDLLVMVTFCTMWFLLFLNFYAVSPRYRLGVYPFLIFIVFYAFSLIVRWPVVRHAALVVVIIAALFYSYGGIEPQMVENDHVLLERSLEYRTDLKLNQLVVKTLQDKYDKYLIGAPFIIAQLLAMPELGYVEKPFNVMIYGFPSTYGGIKNFPGIENLNIARTVYVGVRSMPVSKDFSYPVSPQDRVMEEIDYGNKRLTLFMGGVAIETLYRRSSLMRMLEQRKRK